MSKTLGSDLAKVDATTDEEIARHMIEDDTPEWTDAQLAEAEIWEGEKFIRHVTPIPEHSRVALRRTIHPVEMDLVPYPEGTVGVVVHVYKNGAAYEVEFTEPIPGVVRVQPDEIRRARTPKSEVMA